MSAGPPWQPLAAGTPSTCVRRPRSSHTALHPVPHLKVVMFSTIYDSPHCLSLHFGAGSSDREEMSARMPSIVCYFCPASSQEPIDPGAGCLACGVCLKDCAVTITASFDMNAATTGVVPGRISCCIPPGHLAPGHLGTWAPTAMDHLRTGCSTPVRGLHVCMRHVHRTCTSPRWNGRRRAIATRYRLLSQTPAWSLLCCGINQT